MSMKLKVFNRLATARESLIKLRGSHGAPTQNMISGAVRGLEKLMDDVQAQSLNGQESDAVKALDWRKTPEEMQRKIAAFEAQAVEAGFNVETKIRPDGVTVYVEPMVQAMWVGWISCCSHGGVK